MIINFTPKDYHALFYPEESINIFIKKLNELETLIDTILSKHGKG